MTSTILIVLAGVCLVISALLSNHQKGTLIATDIASALFLIASIYLEKDSITIPVIFYILAGICMAIAARLSKKKDTLVANIIASIAFFLASITCILMT